MVVVVVVVVVIVMVVVVSRNLGFVLLPSYRSQNNPTALTANDWKLEDANKKKG